MDKNIDIDFSNWCSTYNLLTFQSIFERFNIHLNNEELALATKNVASLYFQLLRIPIKNLMNGIIFQQARDYQSYAQNIYIDYLFSGEADKSPEAPGGHSREDLEELRLHLMSTGERFSEHDDAQKLLIRQSQKSLIQFTQELLKTIHNVALEVNKVLLGHQIVKNNAFVEKSIQSLLIYFDKINSNILDINSELWTKLSERLQVELTSGIRQEIMPLLDNLSDPTQDLDNIILGYLPETEEIWHEVRQFRAQFKEIILKATEYLNELPEYTMDKEKTEEHRSSLYFDDHIGESVQPSF